jgi:hypothetical protein
MCFPELVDAIPEAMYQAMEERYFRRCFASLLGFIAEYDFEQRLNPEFYSTIRDIAVTTALNRA